MYSLPISTVLCQLNNLFNPIGCFSRYVESGISDPYLHLTISGNVRYYLPFKMADGSEGRLFVHLHVTNSFRSDKCDKLKTLIVIPCSDTNTDNDVHVIERMSSFLIEQLIDTIFYGTDDYVKLRTEYNGNFNLPRIKNDLHQALKLSGSDLRLWALKSVCKDVGFSVINYESLKNDILSNPFSYIEFNYSNILKYCDKSICLYLNHQNEILDAARSLAKNLL